MYKIWLCSSHVFSPSHYLNYIRDLSFFLCENLNKGHNSLSKLFLRNFFSIEIYIIKKKTLVTLTIGNGLVNQNT